MISIATMSAALQPTQLSPYLTPTTGALRIRLNGREHRQRWQTREELRLAIIVWIERTCHRRRRQRALGKLTPIEFEAVHEVAHAA
jgi:transposase InsO family protein